jgi:hypothetical protein
MLLVKVGLLTEAYGVARMGSEVAINLCWVASGQSEQFPSTDTRATALIRDDTYRTRVWFEEMKKHGHLPKGYDDSTEWGRALHQAKRVEGLPNIEQRANCTPATKELYAFAYRGESGAVHSSAVVLGSRAAGQAPFPAALMLGNVLVASMLILAGVADLLDESRLGEMAKRIRVEVRAKAPGA